MMKRVDVTPFGVEFLVGPVSIRELRLELQAHGAIAVTRDSLERPAHYAMMEMNRTKAWADNLLSLRVFCHMNNVTLYLVGPDPREESNSLWDWYTKL